tara:strand:- start:311 stop:472 length:162 start_codon:yes stop_codon:yes gene_type:complete
MDIEFKAAIPPKELVLASIDIEKISNSYAEYSADSKIDKQIEKNNIDLINIIN